MIICSLYKPPSVNINIFNTEIEHVLDIIQKENKYAYFIADFNIDTSNELQCKSTSVHDFMNLFSSYSYKKLINLPTREAQTSSTLIDNMYTNVPEPYKTGQSGVLSTIRVTDHYPIFTLRFDTQLQSSPQYRTRRDAREQNISKNEKTIK